MNINTIKEHFSIIRDERQSAKVDYPLFDILFGSICAVIAGGQGWTDDGKTLRDSYDRDDRQS
ncbi:transposase family protein, partial [Streptomyces sp. P9(2023)]|uniref:transposase family protein n=1 Tax=Streptomyces sp. P9(2023) TaxID=3064394 RepID=UPI0028F41C29